MQDLTFGEQVKIILSRKDMTIKELAKKIEARTGKKMSRQNMTQRLGRDNFQERDMRMIAEILDCPFYLNILDDNIPAENTGNEAEAAQENKTDQRQETALTADVPETKEKQEADRAALQNKTEEGTNDKASDGMANERDITIGELVEIHKKLDVLENSSGKLSVSEETKMVSGEQIQKEQEEEEVLTEKAQEEYTEQQVFKEEYADEINQEPVEKLLEEIESLEKEEKKEEKQEEKPRGWRAYFKQRFKKFGKDQSTADAESGGSERSQNLISHESERMVNLEDNGLENAYNRADRSETADDIYAEDIYEDAGYIEGGYDEMSEGEYARADYGGVPEEGYRPAGHDGNAEMSRDAVYQDFGYEEGQEEILQEEDTEKGEMNPYTGKEYETNSVRMHPSRIGYVQVYDRENHQWTDMTEWAFLGYQERKKQLLGKDYDPPIYLD